MQKYDIIVIGSGTGGLTASIGLAKSGKKVLLIEKHLIGGHCTNSGCVPSKSFISMTQNPNNSKLPQILREVRDIRDKVKEEKTKQTLADLGVEIIIGQAVLENKNSVRIGDKLFKTNKIIIATGTRPNKISIPGVDQDNILTSETVFELDENIKDLVIIGGGYVGCEFANAFANLGVKVSIIQTNKHLIPKEAIESSLLTEAYFKSKNIDIFKEKAVIKGHDNYLIFGDKNGGNPQKIKYDKILLAISRKPNIENLGLERLGINFNEKGIEVDKYNRTNIKNIFALGDVVEGNPEFSHRTNNEARGVMRNILFPLFKKNFRKNLLPISVFIDLEISRVGLTEVEAKNLFPSTAIKTEIIGFNHNDKSKITQDTGGFIKIIYKRITGKIIGATIAGKNSSEMIPILTYAIQNKSSAYKLSSQIFTYPTKAELIKKVNDQFIVETIKNLPNELKRFIYFNLKQILTILLWLILIILFFSYKLEYSLTFNEIIAGFYSFLKTNGNTAVMRFLIIYTLRPLIFFPGAILTILAGFIWGWFWGFFIIFIGAITSGIFAYGVGKIFGDRFVNKRSKGALYKIHTKLNKSPFLSILFTRLAFFPFDAISYISGFLRVNFLKFILASIVGVIPSIISFVLIGSGLKTTKDMESVSIFSGINQNTIFIGIIVFILSYTFAKLVKFFEQ